MRKNVLKKKGKIERKSQVKKLSKTKKEWSERIVFILALHYPSPIHHIFLTFLLKQTKNRFAEKASPRGPHPKDKKEDGEGQYSCPTSQTHRGRSKTEGERESS